MIGAGPSGLQLGFYLQRAGRDYMIMERGSVPGKLRQREVRHINEGRVTQDKPT